MTAAGVMVIHTSDTGRPVKRGWTTKGELVLSSLARQGIGQALEQLADGGPEGPVGKTTKRAANLEQRSQMKTTTG
jgi:hypothetical protein